MPKIGTGRRAAALVLAVVLSIGGALALLGYVRGLETKALADTEPMEVLVAKDLIPLGMTAEEAGQKGLFERQMIPQVAVLDGAVASLDAITGEAATVDIFRGEQILAERFGEVSKEGLLPIPPDRQAISVEVGIPSGVAGFIEPGDDVSIVARLDAPDPKAQFLLQDVHVLTVGRRVLSSDDGDDAGIGPTQQQDRVLLTLAVTPQDAEKLVFALTQGEVYFTLLPPDQAPAGTSGRTAGNIFQP